MNAIKIAGDLVEPVIAALSVAADAYEVEANRTNFVDIAQIMRKRANRARAIAGRLMKVVEVESES